MGIFMSKIKYSQYLGGNIYIKNISAKIHELLL